MLRSLFLRHRAPQLIGSFTSSHSYMNHIRYVMAYTRSTLFLRLAIGKRMLAKGHSFRTVSSAA